MARPAVNRIIADRYVLGAPLGSSGVVWRGHDKVLGREVAVKEVRFPPTPADSERRPIQPRVLREVRVAARLNHPAAVTLYDVVQDQGATFVVMELVDAPSLADLVQTGGPLPPKRVAQIGAQVASALEAAHRAGIVHGDVKPANVMVPATGSAKLAGLGIPSVTPGRQPTPTELPLGSPPFMAPEQARGETGPPADFWALGATMFYAVEGKPPFDRGTSTATLAAVVDEDPRPMRRAGPLVPLLAALLAMDPRARPSGPELRAEAARVTGGSRPPSSTEVLPSWGPRRTVPRASQPSTPEPAGTPRPPPARAAAGPSQSSRVAPALEPAEPPARRPPPGPAPAQRPSRPVLPPAPPASRRDQRQLAGMLVLMLVALLVVWLANGRGVEPDRLATPRTTRGGAAAGPGEGQRSPAISRGGAGAGATTVPAPSTTKVPSTTRAPTTIKVPTTATTAAPQAGIPAGWTAFTNRAGSNRVGVPPGFRAWTRKSYNATVVEEQSGARRVFTVRSQNPSALLPQASRVYRAWARRNFAGYSEVRYAENQTYAGHQGAVVFEYVAVRDGRRVHVSHINVKGRTWGYNVEFIAPVDRWDASRTLSRQFEQAFEPLG